MASRKAKVQQASTVSKQQQELMDLIQQGLISGEGPLKDLFGQFNEEEFQKGVVKPSLQTFEEEILPNLQHKFIGAGTAKGGAAQYAKNKAAVDFATKLAQQRYQAIEQQKQNRAGGVNANLGKQTVENIVTQPKDKVSAWSNSIPAGFEAVGKFAGGPGGEIIGSAVANLIRPKVTVG